MLGMRRRAAHQLSLLPTPVLASLVWYSSSCTSTQEKLPSRVTLRNYVLHNSLVFAETWDRSTKTQQRDDPPQGAPTPLSSLLLLLLLLSPFNWLDSKMPPGPPLGQAPLPVTSS